MKKDDLFEIINGVRIPFGFLLLEPREHLDKAICGFEDVVIYDSELLIEGYIETGMSYLESLEWISYNSGSDGYFYGGSKDSPAPRVRFPKDEEDSDEE